MHGIRGHRPTHFDKGPAAVKLSKGQRHAVLVVVSLARWRW
jgi:hypothetical protein